MLSENINAERRNVIDRFAACLTPIRVSRRLSHERQRWNKRHVPKLHYATIPPDNSIEVARNLATTAAEHRE